ncbi:MAG: hypothetical protein KDD47_10845 [Acidobacteria bacterium]|nr:hypothetical protein [Acidobacteriota bacterium]
MKKALWILGAVLLVLAVAAGVYAGLGLLSLGAMYRIFGGSGHPPLPHASDAVYISVFAVALPLLSLAAGFGCLRLVRRLLKKRASAQRAATD